MNKWKEIVELEKDYEVYMSHVDAATQSMLKEQEIIKVYLEYAAEVREQIGELRSEEKEKIYESI